MVEIRVKKSGFHISRSTGDIAKALVRTLFETAGYSVFPFGYESYFTHIKDLVRIKRVNKTETTSQLEAMPDFVVLDENFDKVDIELVEVKFRSRKPHNVGIDTWIIERYQKYWPDSTLVFVLPKGDDVFYAKKVGEIKLGPVGGVTDVGITDIEVTEGDKIEFLFPRISMRRDKLEDLKDIARKTFKEL